MLLNFSSKSVTSVCNLPVKGEIFSIAPTFLLACSKAYRGLLNASSTISPYIWDSPARTELSIHCTTCKLVAGRRGPKGDLNVLVHIQKTNKMAEFAFYLRN